jgi:lactoylglutathione lyase
MPLTASAVSARHTLDPRHAQSTCDSAGPGSANVPTMRTLHVGLRVSDLELSVAFYRAVGYTVIGIVEGTPFGSLTMLQLPGDPFVTIELVHDPTRGRVDLGTGFNHLVVQVESLQATLADLAGKGIAADPFAGPDHADGPQTSWITDPEGYRIELVQWPIGHADGITTSDFPERADSARPPAAP